MRQLTLSDGIHVLALLLKNGVGGAGAGIAKAIGPLLVGFWMAYCLSWDAIDNENPSMPIGSFVAFTGLACLGILLLAMLPLLKNGD